MRKITIFLCAVLLSMMAYAQGSENFENADLPGSYSDGSFIGESGLTFTYGESRDQADYPIEGEGLLLRRASDSYLEWTVPDGVGEVSFEYRKAYTGGSIRQLELLINGNQVATSPEFGEGGGEQTEIYTFSEMVNLEGEVTIKIKNVGTTTGNRHSVIDNISWTAAPDNNDDFPDPYCDIADADDVIVEEITKVVFDETTITNDDTETVLIDKTDTVVNVTQGETYTISVEGNTDGDFDTNIVAFIDWNQNGVLDDEGEIYEIGTLTNSDGNDDISVTMDITVPMDAVDGPTRIRITKTYGDDESTAEINPCGIEMNAFGFMIVPGYGQALDFTLDIEETEETGFACEFTHEVDGDANGGSGSSVDSDIKSAVDILVTAGQDFTLNAIEVPFLTYAPEDPPITAEVVYYEDNEGLPGTEIGSETVVPTILSSGEWVNPVAYEFETELEMTPFTFDGSYDMDMTYWIEISMGTATNQETVFWAYTEGEGLEGEPMAQFNADEGSWSFPEADREGIYNFSGECSFMESLGDCTGTPDGGIAAVSPESGNVGIEYSVSASGFTSGYNGLTFQWQSNTDDTEWVDQGDLMDTYSSYTATAPDEIEIEVEWRLKVTCTLSEETSYSDTATFTSVLTYCIPVYTTGCDGGDSITNVTLNGETESINNDSGCSEGGYGDYTNLTPADLAPGSTYTLSVTTDYSLPTYEQARAWIDYNGDGMFSEEEEIANSAGNGLPGGTGTFEFTVPENASPGNLRMRVRMGYGSTDPTFDACDSASWGEAEDYTVEIIALDGCSDAVAGTPEVTGMEVCANTAFTISVTGSTEPADGLERTWQSSPASADDWTAIDGANSEVLSVQEGIAEATDYRYVVTCTISEESDESDVIQVSVNPNATECYCIPEGTNDGRYIDNFSTTGGTQNISNLNSGFSEGGYGDYTDMILETEPGQEVNFEVDIVGGTAGFRIWIDWNNDGTFDPVEEVAYNSDGYGNSHSGLINIPEDAMPGTTRMRIVSHWLSTTGDVDPCETGFTYGEFEDYTFIIAEATDCEGTPDAGIATVDPEVGAVNSTYTVSATGYSTGNGLTYQWQSNTDDDEWVDEGSAEDSYESFVATAPAESDSVVEWRLKVTCTFSEESSYSEVATFTTTDAPLYCTPEGTNDGRYIDNFSTTGGTQNISNLNSGFSAGGYGDYTDMILESEPGQEVNFEVDIVGGTAGFRIWIDWNNDGTFDPVEEVAYNSDGYGSSHSGSINIPEDVMPGTTRMRIVSHWLSTTGDVDPCETGFTYGEFEDYTLTIIGEEEEGYCTPLLDCSEGDVITNVTFLEIDNTTECSPDGYGDYTDMVATVGPGNTYPISVTVGDGYGFESVSVWIDFNDDEVFDEDEFFYIGTGSNQTLTGNIAIPADVTDGSYRMRVRVAAVGEESATWDMSCDESQIFGETEDYTVTVDETLSIDDHKISDFKYYPNPMTDVLFISANESIESVSVYNLLGQQVLSNKHFNNGKVDANSLPTGTYIFRATFENGHVENFKVLKK